MHVCLSVIKVFVLKTGDNSLMSIWCSELCGLVTRVLLGFVCFVAFWEQLLLNSVSNTSFTIIHY